jgi:hypothetical protein
MSVVRWCLQHAVGENIASGLVDDKYSYSKAEEFASKHATAALKYVMDGGYVNVTQMVPFSSFCLIRLVCIACRVDKDGISEQQAIEMIVAYVISNDSTHKPMSFDVSALEQDDATTIDATSTSPKPHVPALDFTGLKNPFSRAPVYQLNTNSVETPSDVGMTPPGEKGSSWKKPPKKPTRRTANNIGGDPHSAAAPAGGCCVVS